MSACVASRIDPFVLSVNISAGGIPKLPQASAVALRDGLQGDGRNHAKHIRPERAVSLWDYELLRAFVAEGFALTPGAAGENLTVRNLHVQTMAPGTLLRIGEAVLKLEQPRKPCYVLDAIDPQLKDVVVGRIGFLASVEREGVIRPGMRIEVVVDGTETSPAQGSDALASAVNSEPPALSPHLLAGPTTG